MIAFSDGIYSEKVKTCLRCKRFFMWGIGTGHCAKYKTDKHQTNHCKYYKRDSDLFYSDGRIEDEEMYNEIFC